METELKRCESHGSEIVIEIFPFLNQRLAGNYFW